MIINKANLMNVSATLELDAGAIVALATIAAMALAWAATMPASDTCTTSTPRKHAVVTTMSCAAALAARMETAVEEAVLSVPEFWRRFTARNVMTIASATAAKEGNAVVGLVPNAIINDGQGSRTVMDKAPMRANTSNAWIPIK